MAEYIERTEELMLAMNAGARAIENTRRYHGAIYTKDVFLESPQEIPYLQAAKVLREVSDAPAADVAPVVHGRWIEDHDYLKCPECGIMVKRDFTFFDIGDWNFCPNCGKKMDLEEEKSECLVDERTAERFDTFCALSDAVEQMPTVDAVPVIRCKDCTFGHYIDYGHMHCLHPCGLTTNMSDDFCSYAERKE